MMKAITKTIILLTVLSVTVITGCNQKQANPGKKPEKHNTLVYPVSVHWFKGAYHIGDIAQEAILKYTPSPSRLSIVSANDSKLGKQFIVPLSISNYNAHSLLVGDPGVCNVLKVNVNNGKRTIFTPNSNLCPRFVTGEKKQSAMSNFSDHTVAMINPTGKVRAIKKNNFITSPYGITALNKKGDYAVVDSANRAIYAINSRNGSKKPLLKVKAHCDGVTLNFPYDITKIENKLYFDDIALNALFSIDLKTRACHLVSGIGKGMGPHFTKPLGITAAGNKIGVVDAGARALFSVDPKTGDREELYHAHKPIQQLISPSRLVVTPSTVFVTDEGRGGVLRIDRNTHQMRVVSSASYGSKTPFFMIHAIAVAKNNIYASDAMQDVIIKINAKTGERNILSGAGFGAGEDLSCPTDMELSTDGKYLYVVDLAKSVVFSINVKTGQRTILSGLGKGAGPTFNGHPYALTTTVDGNLYITEITSNTIMQVNIKTGKRKIISDKTYGYGPMITTPLGITAVNKQTLIVAAKGGLYKLSLQTGKRSIIDCQNNHCGPTIGNFKMVTKYDAQHIIAITSNSSRLYLVNINNGKRSVFY